MLFLFFVVCVFSDPNPPTWEEGVKYNFAGTKPHEADGSFVFDFQDENKWKLHVHDSSVNYPGAYKLRDKIFFKDHLYEVWFEENVVACEKVGMVKPILTDPCSKSIYQGVDLIEIMNGQHFAYVFKGCNFDGYLINYFPHEGIGNNYTFYTDIYNPNRVLKICANGCNNQFIDLLGHEILTKQELSIEFTVPDFCTG